MPPRFAVCIPEHTRPAAWYSYDEGGELADVEDTATHHCQILCEGDRRWLDVFMHPSGVVVLVNDTATGVIHAVKVGLEGLPAWTAKVL